MQKTSKAVRNLGCEPLKNSSAMEVLCKDIIRTWIVPHLSTGTRGPEPKVDLLEVVECILYKLKTGCQWRLLPIKQFSLLSDAFTKRADAAWEDLRMAAPDERDLRAAQFQTERALSNRRPTAIKFALLATKARVRLNAH